MISVYVVDARELVRRGLRTAIDETNDMTVVGESDTPAAARREIESIDPDVVIIDFDERDPAAIALCEVVTGATEPRAVVVSFSSADRARIRESVLSGATNHLLLTDRVDQILDRVREAHLTPPALAVDLVGDLFDRVRSGRPQQRDPLAPLTDREREIIALLAEGLDNRRIGEALHLSPKTVKNYVSAILKKLEMNSRTEAAVFAARAAVGAGV